MAVVLSGREAASRLSRLTMSMNELRRQRLQIDRLASDMEAEGNTAIAIETAINALLVDWASLKAQIITELTAIPSIHQSRTKVGMPAIYNSARIIAGLNNNDLADLSLGGAIRPDVACELTYGNGPFHAFLQNDIVSISSAEDSDNNISAKVLYSAAPGGVDLITNGGFASSTGWTEAGDAGTEVVITGGKAVFTNAGATLSQAKADMISAGVAGTPSIGWVLGTLYLVEFTLDTFTGGSLSVGTNADTAQFTLNYATAPAVADLNATHTALIVGDGHADGLIFTAAGLTVNMDNVKLVPFSGLAFNSSLGSDNDEDKSVVITLQER